MNNAPDYKDDLVFPPKKEETLEDIDIKIKELEESRKKLVNKIEKEMLNKIHIYGVYKIKDNIFSGKYLQCVITKKSCSHAQGLNSDGSILIESFHNFKGELIKKFKDLSTAINSKEFNYKGEK